MSNPLAHRNLILALPRKPCWWTDCRPYRRQCAHCSRRGSITLRRLYESGCSVRRSDIAWLECQRCERDCSVPLCLLINRVASVESIDRARAYHVSLVHDGSSAILEAAHGDNVSADIGIDDGQCAAVGRFALPG